MCLACSRDFEKAVSLDPNAREAKLNLVSAKLAAGNPEDAMKQINAIIQEEPDNMDALRLRAAVNRAAGDFDAAIRDLNTAIKFDDQDAASFILRGQILTKLAQSDDAKKQEFAIRAANDLDIALTLNPKSAEAFMSRTVARVLTNELDLAWQDLMKAAKLDRRLVKENSVAIAGLGKMLWTTGELTTERIGWSLNLFNVAVKLDPDNTHSNFGVAYEVLGYNSVQLGNLEQAKVELEKSIKLESSLRIAALDQLAWLLSTSPDEKLRDGDRASQISAASL